MRIVFYPPTSEPLVCVKCGETKPAEEFSAKDTNRSGRNKRCKVCIRAYYREYKALNRERLREKAKTYRKNTDKVWASRIKCLYGVSSEDYAALLEAQNNGCAICGKSPSDERHQRLCVDHDHTTGQVRGLLCDDCNNVLGRAHDDPDILLKAIYYMASQRKEQVS